MKSLAIAATVIAVFGVTHAAEARTRFEGAAVITSKSGTCAYDPTGARMHARFRPARVGDNGPWSGLSFFQLNGAMAFVIQNGSFTKSAKVVDYTEIYDGGYGGDHPVTVAFTTQVPATITTTTNFIDVTGVITNYDQMKGCTVRFRMGGTRRVE